MQPDERDAAYLWDMLDHASQVVRLVEDLTLSQYHQDRTRQLAVERLLEIIGEAAPRVSPSFRKSHPEIPWRDIIGQRNVLAHEYGDIVQEIVWDTATAHTPRLITLLRPLIPPAPPDASA